MIPRGDRRNGAESGGVEDEKAFAGCNDDVVRVLVLRHDLHHEIWRRLRSRPRENALERPEGGQRVLHTLAYGVDVARCRSRGGRGGGGGEWMERMRTKAKSVCVLAVVASAASCARAPSAEGAPSPNSEMVPIPAATYVTGTDSSEVPAL